MPVISEDEWHQYSGNRTLEILSQHLATCWARSPWLVNAGAGVYQIQQGKWKEVLLDLFAAPIQRGHYAVCGSVEKLPFRQGAIGGIVCVGEVLAYCDPAAAIAEFARVLGTPSILVCDFPSSRSLRHWFTKRHGRAADLVVDQYNGSPERIWIYDPNYIQALLKGSGFRIVSTFGTHTWSRLARRIGTSARVALRLQRRLDWISLPSQWGDVMTVVAARGEIGKG